jgi:cellobiose-specific phosphotransferase system component IIC
MEPIKQTNLNHQPQLIRALAVYAFCACIVSALSVLIADFVVPDHDWMADTISDLGAGEFEFIVDIGIYALSSALIAASLLAAHVHLGGWRWSVGLVGLAVLGLIVFLIGARNEYGDSDNEGVVIHIYLVYALGVLMAVIPAVMAIGATRVGFGFGRGLIAISVLWCLSAPIFFFMPTEFDGVYERYLGLITFALIGLLARLFFLFSKSNV